ncbi:hypothetical protein [Leifsonia aquatica]|uniref:hypothetical protein n=1 Tax=Leifsonia aquatica TaxID=144185 RepID=UPI0037FF9C06
MEGTIIMTSIAHTIVGFDPDAVICSCGRRFEYSEWGGARHAKEIAEQHAAPAAAERASSSEWVETALDILIAAVRADVSSSHGHEIVQDLDFDGFVLANRIDFPSAEIFTRGSVSLINDNDADGRPGGWTLYLEANDPEVPLANLRKLAKVVVEALVVGEQLEGDRG